PALGAAHPAVLDNLNNLAALHSLMNNPAAAEPLYRDAADLVRAARGEDSAEFCQARFALAGAYQQMGNVAAAEPLYRQVLERQRRLLGGGHPDYAQTLQGLARLYHTAGNHGPAAGRSRQGVRPAARL